jgi:hypothetical protein
MFKPFGLSILFAQVVFTFFGAMPKGRDRIVWTAANCVGAVAAWVPVLAYFSMHHGLREMLDASFLYNVHYGLASEPSVLDILSMIADRLLPVSTMVMCLALGLAGLRNQSQGALSGRKSVWILTLLWFGAGLMLVIAAGRGYGHYFMSLTPALALAATLLFWSVDEGKLKGIRLTIGALVLGPVFVAYIPGLLESTQGAWDAISHQRKDMPVDVVARQLQQIASPSSSLLVWGYEPWLFSSTHLRSALRYPTTQYIYDSPRSYAAIGNDVLKGMQATPPDFVVVTPSVYWQPWLHESDPVQDGFKVILANSYVAVWKEYSFTIYKHL